MTRRTHAPLWLLALLPAVGLADVGPALTGLAAGGRDATSVFWSPAAITRLEQSEFVLQQGLAYKDAKFEVDSATFPGGDANTDNGFLLIPGLHYVHRFNDDFSLGLTLNVPSGIGNDFGTTWSGRYLSSESTLTFLAAAAPLAYRVNGQWSIAAGPYVIYTDSENKARVNNVLPGFPDGSVELEEEGADLGWMVGAMFEPTPSTRFGFSYKSEMKPDLDGTPTFNNLDPVVTGGLAAAGLLGSKVKVDFTVPAIAQAGFYTELDDTWAITGDVIWIDLSEFGITHVRVGPASISVTDEGFRDTWVWSVGLERRAGDRTYSIGANYVTEPIKDDRRTIALPLDRVWGVGAGVEQGCWSHRCKLSLSYYDLGEGDVSEDLGPLIGGIEGSFDRNWAVVLDLQVRFGLD